MRSLIAILFLSGGLCQASFAAVMDCDQPNIRIESLHYVCQQESGIGLIDFDRCKIVATCQSADGAVDSGKN